MRDYNQIMSALLPEERRLFNHHIRTLDRKIGPGLTKFTWTSDGIKEFFVRDSCKECAKVYDWVKQFKRNNTEILQVCKKLSELHMIKIEKKTVHRDDEFRDVQERRREEVKAEFNKAPCIIYIYLYTICRYYHDIIYVINDKCSFVFTSYLL